jgi:hypothetical protein
LLYNVETAHRSSLFYNQYEWCITVNISEASCLRYLDSKKFEQAIVNARLWAERDSEHSRGWNGTNKESALRQLREVLLCQSQPFKLVVSFNIANVYTNCREIADQLIGLDNDGILIRLVRQAAITRPAGVIQLRESRYAYRTYLRERKYDQHQKILLKNFLDSRQDLHPCAALSVWLDYQSTKGGYRWSRAHYFVDHDHPNEGTMLSLVMPGVVRKTMPIQTTK